jgi:hypothetical protein
MVKHRSGCCESRCFLFSNIKLEANKQVEADGGDLWCFRPFQTAKVEPDAPETALLKTHNGLSLVTEADEMIKEGESHPLKPRKSSRENWIDLTARTLS